MSSTSRELVQAIVAKLNAEPGAGEDEYVLQFTAVAASAPLTETELQEVSGVQVMVFAGSRKRERITRGRSATSFRPVIGIQRPINLETTEANEALVADCQHLLEQIEERLDGVNLAGLTYLSLDDEQFTEFYNAEALRDLSYFAAAIELEYASG